MGCGASKTEPAVLASRPTASPSTPAFDSRSAQSSACTTSASVVFRGQEVMADIAYVSEAGLEPGISKVNQQAAICRTHALGLPHSACVGLLDGHGPQGHLVTGFVREKLPEAVRTSGGAGSPGKRLGAALTAMHTQLLSSAVDCGYSGCTVAVVLLVPGELHCAWLGDVRVLLGTEHEDGTMHTQPLTYDGHRLDVEQEAERVRRCNGRVERLPAPYKDAESEGPYRVWLKNAWVPGLPFSRTLGDELAHQVGVTSEAELTELVLKPHHRVVLLASSSVLELLTSAEAMATVAAARDAEDGCRALLRRAREAAGSAGVEAGVASDLTACVVRLSHAAGLEEGIQ